MNKSCGVRALLLVSLTLTFITPTTVEANHRRSGYGGMVASPHSRPCHPQTIPIYMVQPAVPQVQSAGIPPALIPILLNVGQDVGSIALDRLIDQIRGRLNQGDLGSQLNQPNNPNPVVGNTDLQSLQTRLEALEKKINPGGGPPGPTPPVGNIRKGAIDKPTGQPAFFPRF
jgi:hypothetical protein